MSKKNKFDLNHLVSEGLVQPEETVYFVSDPSKCAKVRKAPNGEYRLQVEGESNFYTPHAFAQLCLGTEPPNHATTWLRTNSGKTLYELWQGDFAQAA